MPLKKNGASAVIDPAQAAGLMQAAPQNLPASTAAPKAAPKQTAPKASKADSKESYWERKEDRDVETGKRIRRSGVWQAALQSMAGLQFNQGGTLESYLALVDKLAEHGLNWVNKD